MTATLWMLVVLLGVRHAFEPDHLAAVATLVTGKERSRAAARLGATWGLGHSAALLLVASVLTVGRAALRSRVGNAFELLVGAMLVALGAWRFALAIRNASGNPPEAPHRPHAAMPFWIGIVHGLAGSGALTALAASEVPSPTGRLVYVAVFGLGSIAGMMVLSGLAGRLLAMLARRRPVLLALGASTGAFTFLLGLAWIWKNA